jgi:hypothetical protein
MSHDDGSVFRSMFIYRNSGGRFEKTADLRPPRFGDDVFRVSFSLNPFGDINSVTI